MEVSRDEVLLLDISCTLIIANTIDIFLQTSLLIFIRIFIFFTLTETLYLQWSTYQVYCIETCMLSVLVMVDYFGS